MRIANYDGHGFFDGHVAFDGSWVEDASGLNSSKFAGGENFFEFSIPIGDDAPQDININSGMNYQLRLLFWNNVDAGEPTFDSDWTTFWAGIELY